ncbi:MAG TPA: GNAT family N-acetyltransferase [Phycicoccus sp.]|nr:GNAT family N-acetyltransferase [Phycicoccus sp.]
MVVIRSAPLRDLDAVTAYEIARLRQDVFVVEQACVYPDLDGRDLEPGAVQVWAEDGVGVVACLRVLREPGGGVRIGRVATARGARGEGVATALVSTALEEAPRPVVLDAQSHLEGWYSRRGFVRDGAEFVEDGIPHVPMRLAR